MIEIYKNLYVGSEYDYESNVKLQDNWAVVQACKSPYHIKAVGDLIPKNYPEYLIAKRDNKLILNLVDVDNPTWFQISIIDETLIFINDNLLNNKKVLIHCNQGLSRSPSIGMLYLLIYTDSFFSNDFNVVENEFKNIYSLYNPKSGIRGFIMNNWNYYLNMKQYNVNNIKLK